MKIFCQTKDKIISKLWNENLIILSLSAIFTLLILLFTNPLYPDNPIFKKAWDHHQYIYMSQIKLFDYHIAPYCWRILVPFLVKILPFDMIDNFLVISLISLIFIPFVLYKILRKLECSPEESFFGFVLFFSFAWITKFLIWDFWLVDSLLFLIIELALYFILKNNDFIIMLILMLGVLIKENIFIIIPFYLFYSIDTKLDLRIILKRCLLCLPALLLFLIIKIYIPFYNESNIYIKSLQSILTGIKNYNFFILFYLQKNLTDPTNVYYILFGTFGLSTLLLFIIGFMTNKKSLSFSLFLIIGLFQILLAGDIQRVLSIIFPIIVIFAVLGYRSLKRRKTLIVGVVPTIWFLMIVFYILNCLSDNVYLIMKVQNIIVLLFLIILFSINISKKVIPIIHDYFYR